MVYAIMIMAMIAQLLVYQFVVTGQLPAYQYVKYGILPCAMIPLKQGIIAHFAALSFCIAYDTVSSM